MIHIINLLDKSLVLTSNYNNMRKLKKISLKELEKEAICLDESELRLYMGGYDPNDCWWRCIAYINSCGSNYSADDAMEMAREYYGHCGSAFNENKYGFTGSSSDNRQCFIYFFGSGVDCGSSSREIFVFNPNLMEGMGISPSGEYHAIVITRHEGSVMEYFDPQNRTYGQITQEQLDDYTARNGKSSFFRAGRSS